MAPRAAARLELLGFTDVMHYPGGKLDWIAAGLPSEGDNAGHPRAGTVALTGVPVCAIDDPGGDVSKRLGGAVVVDRAGVDLGLLRARVLAGDPAARGE